MAAARAILAGLIRNYSRQPRSNSSLGFFSSSSSPSTASKLEIVYDESTISVPEDESDFSTAGKDDLKSRIFRLRLPKRSATNVIEKWINEGRQLTTYDLRNISKELRKSHRYKHALELSEWMVSHNEYELSDSDYAIRIDLMTKVFGIDAAERYFEGLPANAKTTESYTALLHSYAASKLTTKAEDLYKKMKESGIKLTAITYNELMTLYMSVGEVEKVFSIIKDLKTQNVSPDIYTYNLWISSCASCLKIDEVKTILDEMRGHENGSSEIWGRYINLVKIYLSSGHLVNSDANFLVESEKGVITQREWISYDFLVVLHCGLGNKDTLDQIWKSLRMTNQKMTSRNYACMISAYMMLGCFEEVGEVIDQWKTSGSDFDELVCERVFKGFKEVGLIEKAQGFSKLLSEKK